MAKRSLRLGNAVLPLPDFIIRRRDGTPESWCRHIAMRCEAVCEVLHLPLVNTIIIVGNYRKDDGKYGYIKRKRRGDVVLYYIGINRMNAKSDKMIEETLDHELAHMFEHYINDLFTHDAAFNEMLCCVREVLGG